MKPKLNERGQALVIIALAAVGLFGFSALAIDGSRVFSDRRHAQNAADTASLSAALEKVRGRDYVVAAEELALENGYQDDANSTVEVNLCGDPAITSACQGLPAGDPALDPRANPDNYIQVKITSIIPATLGRVVGRQQFKNIVTAVAYAGPVEPEPFANGAALAALAPHEPDAILGTGNVSVDVNGSGIFSNSDVEDLQPPCQEGSMSAVGNGTFTVDTAIELVGSLCQGNNTTINGPVVPTGPIDYPPQMDIKIPNITCSGTGSRSDSIVDGQPVTTFTPGNHSNINLTSIGEVHFAPGNHCFNGGVKITGPDVIANSVQFKITSGEFQVAGNGTFTCNDVLVHITGSSSGMHFNGNGGNYCNSVTFIASSGDVTWNGNVENRLYAPTGGDYQGLLIYFPVTNPSPLKISGNADDQLTGSIIAVGSTITIEGNSWTDGLNTQIVGYKVEVKGNGNLVINYDPDDQYLPVDPNALLLIK